jgi:hypothetical protein
VLSINLNLQPPDSCKIARAAQNKQTNKQTKKQQQQNKQTNINNLM